MKCKKDCSKIRDNTNLIKAELFWIKKKTQNNTDAEPAIWCCTIKKPIPPCLRQCWNKNPTYRPGSKAIEVNKNFLLICKCFENLTSWEFLMLLRDIYQHYYPLKKSYSSHHVTQRFYRTERLLPEVAQLLCSVEDDGSSQILVWGVREHYLQCYGDDYFWNRIWELMHQWLLKAFENFPPSELWARKDVFTSCCGVS